MDFDTLRDEIVADWRALGDWREQADDDFAFVAGHQWTDEERAWMEEKDRVPVTFNRVATIISAVAGAEINNRTEVRFIPREIGDVKPNEILTAAAEWFRDQAEAEDEESVAFRDALICGVGATETTLDFEEDDEGHPTVRRIDPLEIGWDRYACEKGLRDAKRAFRVREIARSEAVEEYGRTAEEIHCEWIGDPRRSAGKEVDPVGDGYRVGDDMEAAERDTLTVVQVQWRERVKLVQFVDPTTGKRDEMPAADWKKVEAVRPDLRGRPVTRWQWRQAIMGSGDFLDESKPCKDACTFRFVTAHRDRKERRWYGLLAPMRDPQKFANKWMSQVLHIINSNAKGGVIYNANSVDDPREFEESWAAADSATMVRDIAGIMPKPQAQMPAALMQLTEFAISSIRDVSGVNLELLGLRDANQAGILEYQRRQAAMTTLAEFFDSLRYYRKGQGVVMLHFIRDHIAPSGRLVRIVKGDQAQYVPLAMSDDAMKYDVIVDDAPQAPNEKEKAWSVIEPMMPMLVEMLRAGQLSADDFASVLEYSPLPSSFADMIRSRAQEEAQKGPDPVQQAMQQIAMRQEAAKAAKDESTAKLNEAKVAEIAAEAEIAPIKARADMVKAISDATKAQTEAQLAPMRAENEMRTADANIRKTNTDAALAPFSVLRRQGASDA